MRVAHAGQDKTKVITAKFIADSTRAFSLFSISSEQKGSLNIFTNIRTGNENGVFPGKAL